MTLHLMTVTKCNISPLNDDAIFYSSSFIPPHSLTLPLHLIHKRLLALPLLPPKIIIIIAHIQAIKLGVQMGPVHMSQFAVVRGPGSMVEVAPLVSVSEVN